MPLDWQMIFVLVADVTAALTLLSMLIPPVRRRVLGQKAIEDGQKSLLRQEIVKLYYRNLSEKTLRQYEYESLCACYNAYIALGGNSFVKRVYEEMCTWKIIR